VVRVITAELAVDACAGLGEGPAWDAAAGRLIWVDITRSVVHELFPDGRSRAWEIPEHVGAAVPRAQGGLLLAIRSGFAALAGDGSVSVIAPVEADDDSTRMNDGKCDPQGRFWAGTMAYAETPGAGSLYRLDPGGAVHRVLTSVTISNGLGWSPDGAVMYYADTATGGVDMFGFDAASGTLTGRRRLITVDPAGGSPDGMTVDDEGCLWVALWGGGAVRRYRQDGTLDAEIPLPASYVTSCAFGGQDGGDLYITTAADGLSPERRAAEPHAGGVFRCRPGVTGPPATPFAG
jgi:sugar lactone lactonase YvrE